MRRFILYFVILLVSVWIGLKIVQDPGYALFAYHQWTVEMPLWFAFAVGIVAFFILHYLLRSWHRVRTIPFRWRTQSVARRQQKSHQLADEGIFALAKGEWQRARLKFLKAAENTKIPGIAYLGAAIAADQLDEDRERDIYLNKAAAATGDTKLVAGLLNARFKLKKQPVQAVQTLQELHKQAPQQRHVLKLLAKTYQQLKEWPQLLKLLPSLQKQKIFSDAEFEALETDVYSGMLKDAAEQGGLEGLQSFWNKIPRAEQRRTAIMRVYGKMLFELDAEPVAEKFLQKSLEQQWDAELLALYGLVPSKNSDKKLTFAETWLQAHPEDPTLLLVLGRLCVDKQLWGKARSYFEASLAIKPRSETYLELGKLLERLGENKSDVLNCYRSGLDLLAETG